MLNAWILIKFFDDTAETEMEVEDTVYCSFISAFNLRLTFIDLVHFSMRNFQDFISNRAVLLVIENSIEEFQSIKK